MCRMISVLVSRNARVFAVDGVHSHSDIAEKLGLDEDQFLKYEFLLKERKLVQDFDIYDVPFCAKASHDAAAQAFFDKCVGTPEKLVKYVKRGNWDEIVLVRLLSMSVWAEYERVCASARAEYDKVRALALAEYEKVRDSAQAEYEKACASAWAEYEKVRVSTWAEYEKARAPAQAEYEKACASVRAKYEKACASAWVELFSKQENRIEAWK